MSVRTIGIFGLLAAVLLGACDSKEPPTAASLPSERSASPVPSSATPITTGTTASAQCTSRDAQRQRSSNMPAPQRATSPVQLGPGLTVVGGHSPDLLPAPPGAVPKVTASAAWQTAHLPTAGGGTAAIVLGTYPETVPGRPSPVTAWLVYASGVAITNGYVWAGSPPMYGVKGTCAFGYLVIAIDATTGNPLQQGYEFNP